MNNFMPTNKPLMIAGCCSILGALLHVVCIAGGADWYRFMGAGERIAKQVQAGEVMPAVITLLISSLLLVWALFAFSGAGLIRKLPMLRTALVLISSVYLLRGIAGFFLPLWVDHSMVQQNSVTFWWISSTVCCIFGGFYAVGTYRLLQEFA